MTQKKWLALLLALLMLTGAGASAEDVLFDDEDVLFAEDTAETAPTIKVKRDMEHLTVANPTQLKGEFFTGVWGNATSDIDVRLLAHGYNLVEWDGGEGRFKVDTSVVTGIAVTENHLGDRSYTLVLYDDLFFSDGTKITAWHYAFSFLFQMSMEVNNLGGITDRREYVLGSADYTRRTAPLKHTELARGEGDILVEKVLKVKIGEELVDFSDVIGDAPSIRLYRAEEGELLTEPWQEDQPALTVDRDGVIADWHYEGGVRVFSDGTHPYLPGVRVLADDILTITVEHEYLPFFYELGLLWCAPYPVYAIAPGVVVKDDGEGVYLANEDEAIDEPVYTEELLRGTIRDPETGFLYVPNIGAGPYVIRSFDGVTAEFELNPLYKGNSKGEKPLIPRITYTLADNNDMVEKLATGEFDLLNKVTKYSTLIEAMMLIRSDEYESEDGRIWINEGGFQMTNYPRSGLVYVAFSCERPTVSSVAVRQAIAWCMDRDQLVRDYTTGNGLRVDGYYGLAQWMFGIVGGTLIPPVEEPEDPDDAEAMAAYDAEMAAWAELNLDGLTAYTVDLDQARRLLDRDGWKLNDDGLREKDGVVLDLTLIYPAGNEIVGSLEENFIGNLAEVGIRVEMKPVPMQDLLSIFYKLPPTEHAEARREDPDELAEFYEEDGVTRKVDMIYMGTNFDVVFEPSNHFVVENGVHNWASTNNADEELYKLAVDMRLTEPGDDIGYVRKWIAFQERFNETLPMLPIYTNVYFDFYIGELQGYNIDETVTWSQAILGASLSRVETEKEPGEPGVIDGTEKNDKFKKIDKIRDLEEIEDIDWLRVPTKTWA